MANTKLLLVNFCPSKVLSMDIPRFWHSQCFAFFLYSKSLNGVNLRSDGEFLEIYQKSVETYFVVDDLSSASFQITEIPIIHQELREFF